MKVFFLNTASDKWQLGSYMVKEHSVTVGNWLATVVVIPVDKKQSETNPLKDASESDGTNYVAIGVRLEDTRFRKSYKTLDGRMFVIPGPTLFVKYPNKKTRTANPLAPNKVSEAEQGRFLVDLVGQPMLAAGYPQYFLPSQKWVGKPVSEHKFASLIERAVKLAEESHAAWLEEKRAAA